MKVNLGSGYRRHEGFVNVDADPLTKADYIADLEKDPLPFEDSSVDYFMAHHILEHMGEGFFHLMKEIYRTGKHGAILDIVVPHHFHELFYTDPTHRRPITVHGMRLFSKKYNVDNLESFGSSSGMGVRHNVNFEIVWFDYLYDDFYREMMDSYKKRKSLGETTQEEDREIYILNRSCVNVAIETHIKLVVVKDDPAT